MRRAVALFLLFSALSAVLLVTLGTRVTGLPPFGTLLDPLDGVYRTARLADVPPPRSVEIPGLQHRVQIEWDDRGVPHIFAQTDLDAVRVLGYVVARDRLFQLDFLPRAASGRLSEALGPAALPADRFLRKTGMDRGARQNLERIVDEDGEELAILNAYADGVNAFLSRLEPRDLPFEMRVLGYEPSPWTPLQTLRLLQYMNYDLSYRSNEPSYAFVRGRLTPADFELLYPPFDGLFVPIVPPAAPHPRATSRRSAHLRRPSKAAATDGGGRSSTALASAIDSTPPSAIDSPPPSAIDSPPPSAIDSSAPLTFDSAPLPVVDLSQIRDRASENVRRWPLLEGFIRGKGSNNWAVAPERSQTGHAILAGDIHLSVTLPSIWYEVHIVTPSMNTYGVTIPGAPLPVEAFNSHVAWTFTNTGSDQIDHYAVELDASGMQYRFGDGWRSVDVVLDTIHVLGEDPVIDTIRYAHWGPIVEHAGLHVALQWTAHKPSRTLKALYAMNRATTHESFEQALRLWDTPMQNILYADVEGTISIRSTGHLPMRSAGRGDGVLDGSSTEFEWIGRVPFDDLPYAVNPRHGFLTSTNQRPTDSTYAYYLGYDWHDQYRSLRIDSLLRSRDRHGVEDIAAYQSDVHAVQYDLFFPLIDTLSGLTSSADALRESLRSWDGEMAIERSEPLILAYFLKELARLAWDEEEFMPVYVDQSGDSLPRAILVPRPRESRLMMLLRDYPDLSFFDIESTVEDEDAARLLRAAFEATARRFNSAAAQESGASVGGGVADERRWGHHRKVEFRHLIGSPALRALGRGPFEYAGYRETLSPAASPITTHTASWRVVVDFATGRPRGRGVYPGGQRGNPFSRLYDLHIPTYLSFEYYDLLKPSAAGELDRESVQSQTTVHPPDKSD